MYTAVSFTPGQLTFQVTDSELMFVQCYFIVIAYVCPHKWPNVSHFLNFVAAASVTGRSKRLHSICLGSCVATANVMYRGDCYHL